MTRPFVPLILCALLALGVAPVQAAAQDAERPPKELWDQFPLEPSATPTATPAAATPEAPSPRVVEVPADDGMAPGALIALMVAAAGIGGIAARVAVRQLPRHAKSAARVERAEAPQPERTPEERAAPEPARDAPAPTAAPRNAPAPTAAPRNAPAPAPRNVKAAPAPNGKAAPPRDAKAAPSRSAKAAPELARDAAPPAAPRRDAKAAPPRDAKAAPARDAKAAPPRDAKAAPPRDAKAAPPRDADAKAAPKKRRAPARGPKPTPVARAQRTPQPPRAPATPARPPTGRFVPSQPRGASDRCSIKLTKRPPLGRFVAVGDETGQALARSPVFKLKRDTDDTGPTPPEALRELVDDLVAAGWRKTGAGRAPWELRFERVPRGAVTPRANPPRA